MALRSGFYYKTESLSEYTDGLASDIPSVSYDMTELLGDKLEFWVKRFTPKGPTHRLVDSIEAKPVQMNGRTVTVVGRRGRNRKTTIIADHYEVEVSTDVEYAPWVEYDTGKYGPNGAYVIKPKHGRALAFIARDGKKLILARVTHPGSPGAHMFAKGSQVLTDTYINNRVRPILSAFRGRHLTARPFS